MNQITALILLSNFSECSLGPRWMTLIYFIVFHHLLPHCPASFFEYLQFFFLAFFIRVSKFSSPQSLSFLKKFWKDVLSWLVSFVCNLSTHCNSASTPIILLKPFLIAGSSSLFLFLFLFFGHFLFKHVNLMQWILPFFLNLFGFCSLIILLLGICDLLTLDYRLNNTSSVLAIILGLLEKLPSYICLPI